MKNRQKLSKNRRASLTEGVIDNPFESRGIIHRKHDVFNRRVKGEKRNVARARGQATQRRENTLLVDYERSHKANSFRDRRYVSDVRCELLTLVVPNFAFRIVDAAGGQLASPVTSHFYIPGRPLQYVPSVHY